MSSILKALKRIEATSPPSEDSETFFTMPKASDSKQADHLKARRRWFVPGLIAIVLVLLVVVVAAIIINSQRQPSIAKKISTEVADTQKENPTSISEGSGIFRSKIPPGPTNPTEDPVKHTQLAKNQTKQTSPKGNVKNKALNVLTALPNATVNPQHSKSTPAVRSPQSGKATMPKRPLPKEPVSKDSTASKKTIAAKSVPSGKPARKAKKPERSRKYDRIADDKLKLQALAWFDDASKRMVVINNHIVREGGSVDGYQVTQIRKQDVVINDGRKSWRLVFELQH